MKVRDHEIAKLLEYYVRQERLSINVNLKTMRIEAEETESGELLASLILHEIEDIQFFQVLRFNEKGHILDLMEDKRCEQLARLGFFGFYPHRLEIDVYG